MLRSIDRDRDDILGAYEDYATPAGVYQGYLLFGGRDDSSFIGPKDEIGNRMSLNDDQANYSTDGNNALLQKDYRRAETLLLKALDLKDQDINCYHLTLSSLINLYFRMRDEWEGSYDKCFQYCREDIGIILSDAFLHSEWNKLGLPRCISINRLAIDYETKGLYEQAIALCEKAAALGFSDETKSGYTGRIAKLRKKLAQKTV